MQNTPPWGIYAKVLHLLHISLLCCVHLLVESTFSLQQTLQHGHCTHHLCWEKPNQKPDQQSTRPLPAALLHLIGCDRLRPEAFARLATAARPVGVVTAGAPPAPLGPWLHSQIQRGRGPPSIGAASDRTKSRRRKGKRKLKQRQTQRYTG